MLIFILTLLLHMFCYFLILYAADMPKSLSKLCDGTFPISFKQPSLKDLKKDIDDIYIERYMHDVILPSEHYYYLRNNLASYLELNGDFTIAMFTLPISTFLLILQSFRKMSIIDSKPATIFISLAIAIFLSVIVHLVYYKTPYFRPHEYERNISDLKKEYELETQGKYDCFGLSEENRFNNFLMNEFTSYMKINEHTIHIRYALRRISIYIGGAIYIVFFFRIPN